MYVCIYVYIYVYMYTKLVTTVGRHEQLFLPKVLSYDAERDLLAIGKLLVELCWKNWWVAILVYSMETNKKLMKQET